jgi:hypothetical protein
LAQRHDLRVSPQTFLPFGAAILFAANAESVEITKFLQFVSAAAVATSDVVNTGVGTEVLPIHMFTDLPRFVGPRVNIPRQSRGL